MQLLRVLIKENLLKEQDSAPAGAEPVKSLDPENAVERQDLWALKDSKFLVGERGLTLAKDTIEVKAGTEISPTYKYVYDLNGNLLAQRNSSDTAWLVSFPSQGKSSAQFESLKSSQLYSFEDGGDPDAVLLGELPSGTLVLAQYSKSTKNLLSLGGRPLNIEELRILRNSEESLRLHSMPRVNSLLDNLKSDLSSFLQDELAYGKYKVFAVDNREILKRPIHTATTTGQQEADQGQCVIMSFADVEKELRSSLSGNDGATERLMNCISQKTSSGIYLVAVLVVLLFSAEIALVLTVGPFIVLTIGYALKGDYERAGASALMAVITLALGGVGGAAAGGAKTAAAAATSARTAATASAADALAASASARIASAAARTGAAEALPAVEAAGVLPKNKLLRILYELAIFYNASKYIETKDAEYRDQKVQEEALKIVEEIYGDRESAPAAEVQAAVQALIDSGQLTGATQGIKDLYPDY